MKRVLLLPTIILLLMGTFCYVISAGPGASVAAGEAQRPITICNMDDIKTLDIAKMSWANDIRVAMALWEGLMTYNPETLAPEPGVAESFDLSEDGRTYTFHLRKDAKWSNGQPVTPDDFLFGWRRVLQPETGADYIDLFKVVEGAEEYTAACEKYADAQKKYAEAGHTGTPPKPPDPTVFAAKKIDDHTLQVHLKAPCGYFLDLCGFPPFFPEYEPAMRPFVLAGDKPIDPTKGYSAEWTRPPYLITNGAFHLTDWRFKQFLLLEPNPHYYDLKNVKCAKLLIKAIPDARSALMMYQSHTVDLLTFVPQEFGEDLLAQHKEGRQPDVSYRPVFGTYYYMFNCTRPPLDNPKVRKALAMAINRDELVSKVTRMNQKPLGVIVPPDSIPGYTSPPGLESSYADAKKLLADAGFPEGRGLRTLEILYNNETIHSKIAQAIGQMWQQNLGITVSYRGLERGSFGSERRDSHNFDIARGGWYGDYNDPTTWLDLLRTTDGNNDGKFSSKPYDALLDKAAAEPNPAKRMTLLTEAERILVQDELPFIPLYQYGDGFIYDAKKILGVSVNVRLLTPLKWIHRAGS